MKAETNDGPVRRFAWDGFSFPVPEDWDLSEYFFGRGFSSVKMEDPVALRLELEWTRPAKRVDLAGLNERYLKGARRLGETAEEAATVNGLPAPWMGSRYAMEDGRHLVTACRAASGARFACLLRLHFEGTGPRKPERVLRMLASGFALHEEHIIPWEFYDMSLHLGRDFRLVSTKLEAGRKSLVFEWRLRRLFVWQFSLANMLLKDGTPADWGADFLGKCKRIRGVTFQARADGSIAARRHRRFPVGHYDEIGRMCLRYRAGWARVEEKNALVLAVYQYRSDADLEKLARSLDGRDDLSGAILPAVRGRQPGREVRD